MGQHVFVWDHTGLVPVVFDGVHKEFTIEMVNVALTDKGSVKDVLNDGLRSLQSDLIEAMRTGSQFLLNLGMLAPDFTSVYTSPDLFPSELIFDCKRWRKPRHHLRYMRASDTAVSSPPRAAQSNH